MLVFVCSRSGKVDFWRNKDDCREEESEGVEKCPSKRSRYPRVFIRKGHYRFVCIGEMLRVGEKRTLFYPFSKNFTPDTTFDSYTPTMILDKNILAIDPATRTKTFLQV